MSGDLTLIRWREQKSAAAEDYPSAKSVLIRHRSEHLAPLDAVCEAFNVYGGYWGFDMLLWAWDVTTWVSAEDIVIEVLADVYLNAVIPGRLDVSRNDGKPYLRTAVSY